MSVSPWVANRKDLQPCGNLQPLRKIVYAALSTYGLKRRAKRSKDGLGFWMSSSKCSCAKSGPMWKSIERKLGKALPRLISSCESVLR